MNSSSTQAANTGLNGLTAAQAQARLAADGANELPGNGSRNLFAIARDVLAEPMFLLLLAAAVIYLVLGDLREALALSVSILVIIVITILQERRTEHALARLKDLSAARALVVRDGVQIHIAGREVVTGDLLMLNEGDRVTADARLLSATALSVDESILTGESLPVDKLARVNEQTQAIAGNASGLVFSGSLVIRGYGMAQVVATGPRTEMGKIGRALISLKSERTPLFQEVRRIVTWVATAGLLLCAMIAVIYALSRHDWLGGVLAGITVAMGVLPEEFPVVLTIFLAMGAWRISRQGVLTRRMPAIESIGAATLLAVDKTGTLTENRMRVAVIDTLTSRYDLRHATVTLDASARSVLAAALAASERDAFDPMEHAIQEAATTLADTQAQRLSQLQLVREYDLTPGLLAVTHVWQDGAQTPYQVAVKGAPETLFELCGLDSAQQQPLLERVAGYARDGLRVLAVASGTHRESALPDSPRGFKLSLLGLVCLADPLRADVPAALMECTQAGIRVVMITGDHAGTALAIAAQAGIDISAGVLTGEEIAALEMPALCARTRKVNVYARMAPEQKLLLVQAFKANGEIVAMTGDGVNDAPALKAAHIGVAMGSRGTEVAREAASLVLLNDDFASLVGAVRLGRRIYENIRHAMSYIIAVHIPVAGMGLLPVLFGWPLVMYPLHVLFLEFIVDPACSFVFEADKETAGLMRQPPRSPTARLFSRQIVLNSVLRGCVALAFSLGVYTLALSMLPPEQARALAFTAMVTGSVLLIFVSRVREEIPDAMIARPNALFWWMVCLTALALTLVLYVPAVTTLFQFATPPMPAVLAVPLAGLLVVFLSLLRRYRLPAGPG
ncbi:MAG: cation-translocating P-type ATPase [Steroidobacteraceae bacterium]